MDLLFKLTFRGINGYPCSVETLLVQPITISLQRPHGHRRNRNHKSTNHSTSSPLAPTFGPALRSQSHQQAEPDTWQIQNPLCHNESHIEEQIRHRK